MPIRHSLIAVMMLRDDLDERGIKDNTEVTIESQTGSVTTTVASTDQVMRGVVSLPHGWGHQRNGIKMSIARQQQGVNCNELTDDGFYDQLNGNAALNGVIVKVTQEPS